MTKPASKIVIPVMLVTVALTSFLFYKFFYTSFGVHKSPQDIVDKENPKLVELFNIQLGKEIDRYKSGWYAGCIPDAYKRVDSLFKTIKQIESYTRYGLKSTQRFNKVEVNITYNNGKIDTKLYTDISVQTQYGFEAPLLLKLIFENGKLSQAFSNGVERNSSPQNCINDLNKLITVAIHKDYDNNRVLYFPAAKTKADFDKEWEVKKK